ncbi:hypothetical protein B0H13DRAFT_2090023 [Mycena leptocephala]|nr:hypothetical protein B0H13DRAFT_2090023 [Mycena leptocephala]
MHSPAAAACVIPLAHARPSCGLTLTCILPSFCTMQELSIFASRIKCSFPYMYAIYENGKTRLSNQDEHTHASCTRPWPEYDISHLLPRLGPTLSARLTTRCYHFHILPASQPVPPLFANSALGSGSRRRRMARASIRASAEAYVGMGRNAASQALRSQVQVVRQHTSSSPLHIQHETHPHRLRTAIVSTLRFSRAANRSSSLWNLFWVLPSSLSVIQCTAAAECMYSNDNGQSKSAFDSDNREARAAHPRIPPGLRPQPRRT